MSDFRPAKKRISVSVGESVRILRELQEYSQNDLAGLTGIPRRPCPPLKTIESGWDVARDSAA